MSAPLWTAAEAAAATGGQAVGGWAASGVSIDSRSLRPGDLFVALKNVRDGHDFVGPALAGGAAAALVSRRPEGVAADAPLLLVADVMAALEALARAARTRSRARVLAITGSAGKTSSKDMAACALGTQGRVHAAEASLNNHWGVPLTLARLPREADFAVFEIGMNHPGEIAPLARLVRPHVALITTVAAAHLEAFDGITAIAREKASIFTGLGPGGVAVIPDGLTDHGTDITAILREGAGAARVVTFGHSGDVRLTAATGDGATIRAEVADGAQRLAFTLAAPGLHFALNATGVLAAIGALGADPVRAAEGLAAWRPYKGRGGVEHLAGIILIDDSYNANPASLAAGLDAQARLGPGRRVAILGDMLELGPDEAAIHRAIATWPQIAGLACVHACGSRMKHMMDALPADRRGIWAEDAAGLCARIDDLVRDGDIVLVKGSKSSGLACVVDALRRARHMPKVHSQG